MFQPWRLKVREAEAARQAGRLEEASRLLEQPSVCEFLPAKQLLAEVANDLAARAKSRLAGGESAAGWRDLERAASLGADATGLQDLRQAYVKQRLAETAACLRAGAMPAARAHLKELARHGLDGREVRAWQAVVALAGEAQSLSRQGQFAQAAEVYGKALHACDEAGFLEELQRECTVKMKACQDLTERLHAALAAENWRLVLERAEGLLDLCPEHQPAREARRRAWQAVGIAGRDTQRVSPDATPAPSANPGRSSPMNAPSSPTVAPSLVPGPRFLMWVDGVGGYLVCEGNDIVIGQPLPDIQVDVPILGDISRQHCRIRRDGESYLLVALRPTKVDGRDVSGAVLLSDGALIEMGQGVQLRFRRPHPLSSTARLEFASRHRTLPAADGVLLLADSCVLGPNAVCHVPCREWTREVVLFKHTDGQLRCRTAGAFTVDGKSAAGKAEISRTARISGEDFSFSLEQL